MEIDVAAPSFLAGLPSLERMSEGRGPLATGGPAGIAARPSFASPVAQSSWPPSFASGTPFPADLSPRAPAAAALSDPSASPGVPLGMRELHRRPPAGLALLTPVWDIPDVAQLFASHHEAGGGPGALPAPPVPWHAPLGQPLSCSPGISSQVCILVASAVQSPIPVPAGARIRNCMLWVHLDGDTVLAHAALPLPTLASSLPPDGALHPSSTLSGSGEHVRGLTWLGPPSPSGSVLALCGQYFGLVSLPGAGAGAGAGAGTGRLTFTPLLPREPWGGSAMVPGALRGEGARASLFLSPGELRAVAVNPFAQGIIATACQDGTVTLLALGEGECGEAHAVRVLRVLPTLARSPASDVSWSPYTPHLLAWTLDGGGLQWTRLPPTGTLPHAPAVMTLLTPGPATFALAFLDETTLLLGHGSGAWQPVRLTGAELAEGELGAWTRDPAVPEVGYVLPAPRGSAAGPAHLFACAGTEAVSVWRVAGHAAGTGALHAECVAHHRVSSLPPSLAASTPFVQLTSALPACMHPWLREAYGPWCFPLRPRVFASWANEATLVLTDTNGAITVARVEVPAREAGRIRSPTSWASPGEGWAALLGGAISSSEGSSSRPTPTGALTSPTRFGLPGSSSSARAVGTPRGVGGLEHLGDFPPSASSSGDGISSPAPHGRGSTPAADAPKWVHFG